MTPGAAMAGLPERTAPTALVPEGANPANVAKPGGTQAAGGVPLVLTAQMTAAAAAAHTTSGIDVVPDEGHVSRTTSSTSSS